MTADILSYFGNLVTSFTTWWTEIAPERVIFALLIVALAFLARRPLANLVVLATRALMARFKVELPESAEESLRSSFGIAIAALGLLLGAIILDIPGSAKTFGVKVLGSIAVVAIFAAISASLEILDKGGQSRRLGHEGPDLGWAARIGRVFIAVAGLSMVLRIWGVDISSLLTGVGVLGAAMAYIMQDALRAVTAGLLASNDNRFAVGEWIKVEGVVEGTVLQTRLHSTLIEQFDLGPVWVPNMVLTDSPLVNYSRRPHRRIYWTIGLDLATTSAQLIRIRDEIERFILESEDYETAGATYLVRIDGFSASSIDLMVYCFTKTTVFAEYKAIAEALALKIKETVENEGARLAIPAGAIQFRTPLSIETPEPHPSDHAAK